MPSDPIPATLFDGVSARDHAVIISVVRDRIEIVPVDFATSPYGPLLWPLADSYRVADGHDNRLTVSTRGAPDARLVIDDRGLRATLAPLLPVAQARTKARRSAVRWSIGLGVAVLAIVATVGLVTRYAAQLFPAGWGATLSDRMLAQMTAAYPMCTGAGGTAALDRLATRMTETLGIAPPKVVTVKWDLVNAFALPGDRVVLTSGLIASSGRPAVTATVLAHEIGHVARRDPLARVLREKLLDVAVASVFGLSVDARSVGAVTGYLLESSYTRDQEAGADAVAVRLLNALDIAPGPGAAFFDALAERQSAVDAIALLSSHPLPGERAASLRRHGVGTGPGLTPDEWQAVRTMCD